MVRLLWLLALAGCGRIGFDPSGAAPDAGDASPIDVSVTTGLVAYYPLDDDLPTATTVLDASGNDFHGSCQGGCPNMVPVGVRGSAVRFDGTKAIVIPAAMTALDFNGAFTITAWVKLERRPATIETIVARPFGSADQNTFSMHHAASGKLEHLSQPSATQIGISILPIGTWTHVAISYDGMFRRLYVGGADEGSGSTGVTPTYDDNKLWIGAERTNDAIDHYFEGVIDEVMLFDRALSDTEIAALAQ